MNTLSFDYFETWKPPDWMTCECDPFAVKEFKQKLGVKIQDAAIAISQSLEQFNDHAARASWPCGATRWEVWSCVLDSASLRDGC